MKKYIHMAFLAVCAVLVSACASSGNNFKDQNLGQLQPGITTVTEAQALFEAPPVQTVTTPGGQIVYWRYINSNGMTARTTIKEAGLLFSADGRFQRVIQLQNVPVSDADRQRLFSPQAAEL